MHLRIGGRLDRYVARGFLSTLLATIGSCLLLVYSLGVASNVARQAAGGDEPFWILLYYSALDLPFVFIQSAPLTVLIAGQVFTALLMRSNEVTAALAAGVSAPRMFLPVVVVSAVIASATVAFQDPVLGAAGRQRDLLSVRLEQGLGERELRDVWFCEAGGASVHVGSFVVSTKPSSYVIHELEASVFQGNGWVQFSAKRGTYVDGEWLLEDATRTDRTQSTVHVEKMEKFSELVFQPSDIFTAYRGQEDPLTLGSEEAKELARRSPSNIRWATLLEVHRAAPWGVVALTFLGVASMLSALQTSIGQGVFRGFLAVFAFIACDLLCRSLGLQGRIPPLWAGWVPLLLFGSLGVVSYVSVRS